MRLECDPQVSVQPRAGVWSHKAFCLVSVCMFHYNISSITLYKWLTFNSISSHVHCMFLQGTIFCVSLLPYYGLSYSTATSLYVMKGHQTYVSLMLTALNNNRKANSFQWSSFLMPPFPHVPPHPPPHPTPPSSPLPMPDLTLLHS